MNPRTALHDVRWWAVGSQIIGATPPSELTPWIRHRGSLTRRLRRRFGAGLSLEVSAHRWTRAGRSESMVLDVDTRRRCLERRVVLGLSGEPLVLGRTLAPVTLLEHRWRRLRHLGERALGDLLFANPVTHRQSLQIALLDPGQLPFPELNEPTWARRSLFVLGGERLVVYEAFLPRLLDRSGPLPQFEEAA